MKFTVGELVGLALPEVDGGLSCGGHVGGWRGEGEGGGSQPPPNCRKAHANHHQLYPERGGGMVEAWRGEGEGAEGEPTTGHKKDC